MRGFKWLIVLLFFMQVAMCFDISKIVKFPYNITIPKDGILADPSNNEVNIGRPMIHKNYLKQFNIKKRDIENGEGIEANIIKNDFNIIYVNEESIPEEVKSALNYATEIWSSILDKVEISIVVSVSWVPLGTNVLGSAGPRYIYLNNEDGFFYSDAQMNQIAGENIESDTEDIVVRINSDYPSWHFGINESEAVPSGKYDLATVMLHELGHGLGIIGLISGNGGYGGDGIHLFIYDSRLIDKSFNPILNENTINDSSELIEALDDARNNGGLFFYTNKGVNASLYNPSSLNAGSSIYHLDETTYPPGDKNSLMTPFLSGGERILNPGPIGSCLLSSMGWNLRDCSEYNSNCEVCTRASCTWCNSLKTCIDPAIASESILLQCSSQMLESCTQCTSDSDCNDMNDMCTTGICNLEDGNCEYTEISCDDNIDCTYDICDFNVGCLNYPRENKNGEDECNIGICKQHLVNIEGSTKEFGQVDASEIERYVFFDEQYENWNVIDAQVNIVFDKVDASCNNPSHGHAWANELYIKLEPNNEKEIQLITTNTFTSNAKVNGPFSVTFKDNTQNKINSVLPQNGTFRSIQSIKKSMDIKVTKTPWKIVFGDIKIGDPACFYSATIKLLLEPPNFKTGENTNGRIVCGNDTKILLNDITLNLDVPENLFELESEPIVNKTFTLDECINGIKNAALTTLNDIIFTEIKKTIIIPVRLKYLELCSKNKNLIVTYAEEFKEDEEWELRAGESKLLEAPIGHITLNSETNVYELYVNIYIEYMFIKSNSLVKRRLKEDKPPGYKEKIVSIFKNGIWNFIENPYNTNVYFIELQ